MGLTWELTSCKVSRSDVKPRFELWMSGVLIIWNLVSGVNLSEFGRGVGS